MLKIGITGGIGSGKSEVCRYLESLGYRVIYADRLARSLMENDPSLIAGIKAIFGEDAYKEGKINNRHIAAMAFGNRALLDKLNALVHPVVIAESDRMMSASKGIIFYEAALIFESGMKSRFDKIIVITAPDELRIERIVKRGGITREEAAGRLRAQIPQNEKAAMADFVLSNDSTLSDLRKKTDQILASLTGISGPQN